MLEHTETANKDGTWLLEISSCCCLTPAGKTKQLLLNKIYIPFLPSLYTCMCFFVACVVRLVSRHCGGTQVKIQHAKCSTLKTQSAHIFISLHALPRDFFGEGAFLKSASLSCCDASFCSSLIKFQMGVCNE